MVGKVFKHAETGHYAHYVHIEGAEWDEKNKCLVLPKNEDGKINKGSSPKLFSIHLEALEKRANPLVEDGRWYECPVYTSPVRGHAYVFTAHLPIGKEEDPDDYALAGVALFTTLN